MLRVRSSAFSRLLILESVMLRAAAAGQANAPLVVQTRPGRAMYSQLSGDRTHEAEVIYDWVVTSNVA